ncbi:MAG: ferritin-like domain-containing protein [Alphaproteobacteria bacterium]|nr:ferritin-like domain-containing protein [Alphaproteobacteria bacterium]
MDTSRNTASPTIDTSRRRILTTGGLGVLSATAVALLAGNEALAQQQRRPAAGGNDVAILNVALGLEHEAIAAYQIGAESNLLQPAVLQVAVAFQGHHKAHRDALVQTIRQMGGNPVAEKSRQDYMTSLAIASTVRNQADVLKLAQRLERGAANAYLGVIPSFASRDLAKVAGRLAADETMHYTALTQALNEALPGNALSFGA